MKKLAELPNVYVKISMIPFILKDFATNPSSQQKIKQIVKETISTFGSNRCMFGSNYPVDKPVLPPKELYALFASLVEDLPESDQSNLFYHTAEKVYKL